jgi:hypothetical protein
VRRILPIVLGMCWAGVSSADSPLDGAPECQTLPPDAEFRHYTGYGVAGSEVVAVQTARGDAYEQARTAVCAGRLGKRRCEATVAHLAQLDEQAHYIRKGYSRRERWRACFTLQIERKYVDLGHLQENFRRDLGRMAAQVSARFGRESLRIEPPVWAESQCSVGGVGEVLLGEVAGAFANQRVRIDDSNFEGPSMRMQLARTGDGLNLVPTYVNALGVTTRMAPVAFLPELYGLEDAEEPSCRWDNELGLTEGHRSGADGRTARMIISGNSGEYCEGDRMEPIVLVDRPSRVRVYSVERDGRALVIWPYSPDQDDLVERSLSLGEAQVQRPKLGEERLVAVAVPAEQDFGELSDWRGCYWPTTFGETAIPPHAAVGSVGFLVAPEGTEGCPMDVSLIPFPMLPTCGG